MTAQQQVGLVGPAWAGGMVTRTAALAGQQQACSARPASCAWRLALSGACWVVALFFLGDGCRFLAFMAPASPGRRAARK